MILKAAKTRRILFSNNWLTEGTEVEAKIKIFPDRHPFLPHKIVTRTQVLLLHDDKGFTLYDLNGSELDFVREALFSNRRRCAKFKIGHTWSNLIMIPAVEMDRLRDEITQIESEYTNDQTDDKQNDQYLSGNVPLSHICPICRSGEHRKCDRLSCECECHKE